jgi:pyridoxine 4-dehydrogenase
VTEISVKRLQLGGTLVSRVRYGAVGITGRSAWGPPGAAKVARILLRRLLEFGPVLVDTADSYGPAVSETLIADALFPYPADMVIATKGGLIHEGPGSWRRDCSPPHLRAAVETSLKRLRIESIYLYQLHSIDPRVPYEKSIETLKELQQQGKIRHIGVCNVSIEHLRLAVSIAELVSVQNSYSIVNREHDDVLEECRKRGLLFIASSPLEGGHLAIPGSIPGEFHLRRGGRPSPTFVRRAAAPRSSEKGHLATRDPEGRNRGEKGEISERYGCPRRFTRQQAVRTLPRKRTCASCKSLHRESSHREATLPRRLSLSAQVPLLSLKPQRDQGRTNNLETP